MESKGCLKYHSKGVFYLGCKFLFYHQDLKYNDSKKLSGFINQLRGEWFFEQGSNNVLQIRLFQDRDIVGLIKQNNLYQ